MKDYKVGEVATIKLEDGTLMFGKLVSENKLADIPVGETFGGFIVLEHFDNGTTAIIREDSVKGMEFGDNNDWRRSKVREYLNDEYLKELEQMFGTNNIIEHTVDLWSHDGFDDYGKSTDKVSLLTFDQYRKYHQDILKTNLSSWWWLLTPDSTPSGYGAGLVQYVGCDGFVGCDCCDFNGGVRPFCILKSDIFVS